MVWLIVGRRLTLLVDKLNTAEVAAIQVPFLYYDSAALKLGGASADSDLARLLFDLPVRFNGDSAFIDVDGEAFELGTITRRGDSAGEQRQIIPASRDSVSYAVERSVLAWPVFELNFMTGHAPSFKRHLYHRLIWRKRSGRQLEMLWRFEQWKYPALGWSGVSGMASDGTGLIRKRVTG
jgi:hypothetical protein